MDKDFINSLILAALFAALFTLAELAYHLLKVKVELTRKFVHVGTGLLTFLFPNMIDNQWFVFYLCAIFAIVLMLSLKFNLLKSINAIERDSVGSIAYPISVYGCYLAYDFCDHNIIYFYLPILILAICDPIAALSGKKWPLGKFKVGNDYKTVVGSMMFFLSASVITSCFLMDYDSAGKIFFIALSIAFISTISEAFSKRGYDNFFIPLSVLVSLFIIERFF